MSVILDALEMLDRSVDKLEGALPELEQNLKGSQRDMFPEVGANQNAAMAGKIDSAIEKVEALLAEA